MAQVLSSGQTQIHTLPLAFAGDVLLKAFQLLYLLA